MALIDNGMTALLVVHGQTQSTCAKHLMGTMAANKQRPADEIKGSLQGLQFPLYQFARARTKKAADEVLLAIKQKNPTVEKYLRKRTNEIAAYAFLDVGVDGEMREQHRGGHTTGQLVESFNCVALPLRRARLISGTLWLLAHAARVLEENLKVAESWAQDDYSSVRIASLAPNASKEFVAQELSKNQQYVVASFQERTLLTLIGVVIRVNDISSSHVMEVRRA